MLKKCFAAALVLLMLAACLAAAEEVPFEPIHISLWGEPTSGYEWACEFEDNGVLEAPILEYVEGAEGASGGTFDFYFGVLAPGRAQLSFNYGVSWGIEPPARTALCTVDVREDGHADLIWTECYADDHLLEIVLPTNPTTGWNWNYAGDSADIVTLLREHYEPDYADLEGAGGKTTYELQVDAPGQTLLLFNYASMWDPDAAAEESYVLQLDVSEDMEIAMEVGEDFVGLEIDMPVDESEGE